MYAISFLSAPLSIYTVPYKKITLSTEKDCKTTDCYQRSLNISLPLYVYWNEKKITATCSKTSSLGFSNNEILPHQIFYALFKANPVTMTKTNHSAQFNSLFYIIVFAELCWVTGLVSGSYS